MKGIEHFSWVAACSLFSGNGLTVEITSASSKGRWIYFRHYPYVKWKCLSQIKTPKYQQPSTNITLRWKGTSYCSSYQFYFSIKIKPRILLSNILSVIFLHIKQQQTTLKISDSYSPSQYAVVSCLDMSVFFNYLYDFFCIWNTQ